MAKTDVDSETCLDTYSQGKPLWAGVASVDSSHPNTAPNPNLRPALEFHQTYSGWDHLN